MIERVLRLADKPVRALMTPRTEIAWIDRTATAAGDRGAGCALPPSRASWWRTGAWTTWSAWWRRRTCWTRCWRARRCRSPRAMRQPLVLPDTLSALDALERLRHDPIGMALVMDEYGSFEGVVTASDLLEAIIGDWRHDAPDSGPCAVQRHDGSLLLDGMMPSDELKARLDLPDLPREGTYHTVAGLMLALLQRVPREGDRIAWAGWRFEIVDMDGRRVDKVLATREEAVP